MKEETKKKIYIFPLNPLPKMRMTQKSKWTPRAQKCLQYQRNVAQLANIFKMPILGCKYVTIQVLFVRFGRECDTDNLEKALLDGLQYGGVFENDKQVKIVMKQVNYTKVRDEAMIKMTIEEYDPSHDLIF